MAALAATALLEVHSRAAATWTVLCGLFLTVTALLLLPQKVESK